MVRQIMFSLRGVDSKYLICFSLRTPLSSESWRQTLGPSSRPGPVVHVPPREHWADKCHFFTLWLIQQLAFCHRAIGNSHSKLHLDSEPCGNQQEEMVEDPPASSSAALLAAGGSSSFAQPLPRALLLQHKHHSLVPTTVGCTPNCLEDKDSETASLEWTLKEDAYVELPYSLHTPMLQSRTCSH